MKMVNFLSSEMKWERWINQHDTSVGQRNIFPDRNWTHDLPNTWRTLRELKNSPSSFTYHHSRCIRQCWSQQCAGRLSHMNSVKWLCSPRVLRIFIHFSLLTMNSTVLILAVCRTPVTWTQLNGFALHGFSGSSFSYHYSRWIRQCRS